MSTHTLPTPSAAAEQITVYTPQSQLRQPRVFIRSMIQDLIAGQHLAWRLAVRDIQAMYRGTLLGIAWAFFIPLATTVTWLFLSASGVVTVAETGIPYPIYIFTGTMLWAILTDALRGPIEQCTQAKPMLSKLNFPRESLIIASVYKTCFDAAIKIALLLLALLVLGRLPGWQLLLLPLGIASLMLAGLAVGLLLTPVSLLYGDISKAIPLAMQFGMYLTPVVFPMPEAGWARTLILLNPLTPILVNTRNWLTGMGAEHLSYFLVMNAVLVATLLFGWIVYRAVMPVLIERMNA